MEDERPRLRWIQFRLRTLLIAILVLSLPLSWFGDRLRKARRQREAVEVIRRWGRNVTYDWETDLAAKPPPIGKKPYPLWLRELLGDDFFFDVDVADCGRTDFGDVEATCLKGLGNLEWLLLYDTQITDVGLGHLEGLTELQVLDLDGAKISDAGLEHLKGLTSLKWLSLDDTQITDAGLEHLKRLPKFEYLSVKNTNVSPEGVKKLQEALPNCEIKY